MNKEQTIQDVWLGREFKDHAKDLSLLITEFLESFTHSITYKVRLFPPEKFRISTFYGIITQECTDPETSKYIHKVSRSARKWILHQELEEFKVVLADEESVSIAEYAVKFYQPDLPMKRKVYEFSNKVSEVKKQLKIVLEDFIQKAESVRTDKLVALRIYCKLARGTVLEPKLGEHEWDEIWPTPSENMALLDSGPPVDTKLLQLRFQYRKVEEPIDEYADDPNDIELSMDYV